jgi:hypothetical protein
MKFLQILALLLATASMSVATDKISDYERLSSVDAVSTGKSVSIEYNSLFTPLKSSDSKYLDVALSANELYQFEMDRIEADILFSGDNKNLVIKDFQFASDKKADLVLVKTKPIYDERTTFKVRGKVVEMPKIDSYYGYLKGEENSHVYLTEFKGRLSGSIVTDSKTYNIGEVFSQQTGQNIHVIKEKNVVLDGSDGITFCGVEEDDFDSVEIPEINEKDLDMQKNAEGFVEVVISTAGTYDYLRRVAAREGALNSNPDVDDLDVFFNWEFSPEAEVIFEQCMVYMVQVMDMTSRIYERQANVRFRLATIEQFGSDDPMIDIQLAGNRADASVKLNRMPDIWNNRTDGSHFVVLFNNSTADNGSNILGIAMSGEPRRGNFCIKNRSYCVVGIAYDYREPSFDNSGDIHTTAHELGHLFGVPHTHNRYWFVVDPQSDVRDTCVTTTSPGNGTGDAYTSGQHFRRPRAEVPQRGTIMSYCHIAPGGRVSDDFHPYIASNYLGFAARRAQCVNNPDSPVVRLTNFLGRNIMSPGTEEIEWRSFGISSVDLRYRIDGGDWITIAENVDASLGGYNWVVPSVETSDLQIEIYKSGDRQPDTQLYDRSLLGVRVQNRFVSITAPEEDEPVGQQIDYLITWEDNLVNNFQIDYQYDGSDWKEIGRTTDNSISWDAPDDFVGDVLIRVIEVGNSSLSDIVSIDLGKEDGIFLTPVNNDTICEGSVRYDISFATEYVDMVNIKYSTDGGNTYRNLGFADLNLKVDEVSSYEWPEVRTTGLQDDYKLALFAVNTSDGDDILLQEINLIVDDCPLTSVEYDLGNIGTLSVSPNPASDMIDVQFDNTYSILENTLQIIDLTGRVLYERTVNTSQGINTFEISVENLPSGNYTLVIGNETGSASQNVIIKR